jgi:hypothetical protein
MAESTSAMMIRDVPIDLSMRLKALAAMQHRRLRDVAIEALREKAEKHRRRCRKEITLVLLCYYLGRGGILLCQRRRPMDVHASPDALPELKGFLARFQVRFRRPEGAAALERYTTGLRTERPNKNCDPIAQALPGTSEQRLQAFLTNMPWAEDDLHGQRVHKMVAEATLGDGGLVLDDPGFPEQGKASVGVARQYSGPLGKGGNCQLAVTCCDTDPQATWPVEVRLYLPKSWAEDPERRGKARVPADVSVQTKPAIALRLLDQARAWGVPHRGVVAAADDGDNPPFLAALAARQERYVVAVRADCRVSAQRKATTPSQRLDRLLQALPRGQWRTIRWRHGTQGWLRKKFVAVRCWRVTPAGQRHAGWLLGERAPWGQPEERQDS